MPGISLPPDRLGGVPSWPVLGVPPRGANTTSQLEQALAAKKPILLVHEQDNQRRNLNGASGRPHLFRFRRSMTRSWRARVAGR